MDKEVDVRKQKVDVPETVVTIRLDEDGETETSRIGGEEGDSDVKGNRSEGNEVKVKDLKKGDDFSTVIDVKCDGGDGKLGEDCQRVCRICHLSTSEAEKNLVDLIELGCGCKGELEFVHSHCAEAWFKLKGNRKFIVVIESLDRTSLTSIKRAARCNKAFAMRRVRGRARPQGSIVRSLTLHFCQRLFPRLELVTSCSHGSNFTNYSKASKQEKKKL